MNRMTAAIASILSSALVLNPLFPALAFAQTPDAREIRARYENLLEQGKYLYQMQYEFGHDVCDNPNDPDTCTLDPVGNKVCRNPHDRNSCHFEGLCVDHDTGDVLEDTVVVDRTTLERDQEPIVCAEKAKQLAEWAQLYQRDLAAIEAYEKQCPDCAESAKSGTSPSVAANSLASGDAVNSVASLTNEGPACHADQHKVTWENCKQDFKCDMWRSVPGLSYIVSNSSCAKTSGQQDCLASVVAGLLKDMASNITGLWDLTKLGASYLWKKIRGKPTNPVPPDQGPQAPPISSVQTAVQGWKSFENVENASSKKVIMATNTSEKDVVSFTKDPVKFMQRIADGIWNWMKQSVKESFACEKWEGAPYRSRCVQPLSNFDCASCDQWLNTACGVIGVLGGEVVTNLVLTFGIGLGVRAVSKAAEATKVLARLAAGKSGAAVRSVTASLRARSMNAAANFVTKGTNVVKSVGSFSANLIKGVFKVPFALWGKIKATGRALRESAIMKKIAEVASGNRTALVLSKIGKSTPVRAVFKAGKLGIAPVRGYLYVFGKAGEMGFHLGTATGMKAEVAALVAASKVRGVSPEARAAMLSRAAGLRKSIEFLGQDLRKAVRTMPVDLRRIGKGQWLPPRDEVAQAALTATRESEIQKAISAKYDEAHRIDVDLEGVPIASDETLGDLPNATEKIGPDGGKQLELDLGPECNNKSIMIDLAK